MRRYVIADVPSLEDVHHSVRSISGNFCLFLANDATAIPDEDVRKAAALLLQEGIAYLCVWGPDCERVHDLFDLECIPDEPEGRCVMATGTQRNH